MSDGGNTVKAEAERRRLGGLLEKLQADLSALTDGAPSRLCASCPQDCCARLETDIERARARLRELNDKQNHGGKHEHRND